MISSFHKPAFFCEKNQSVPATSINFKLTIVCHRIKTSLFYNAYRVNNHHENHEQNAELSLLRRSIRPQILFHQVSQIGLQRGLYLCYVQAKSSLEDGMQVIGNANFALKFSPQDGNCLQWRNLIRTPLLLKHYVCT